MEIRDESSTGRSMFLIEEEVDLTSALCQFSPEVRKERYIDSGKGSILKHLHLHARAEAWARLRKAVATKTHAPLLRSKSTSANKPNRNVDIQFSDPVWERISQDH